MKTIFKIAIAIACLVVGFLVGAKLGEYYFIFGTKYLNWQLDYVNYSKFSLFIFAAVYTTILVTILCLAIYIIVTFITNFLRAIK
jgi:hypothetical protein